MRPLQVSIIGASSFIARAISQYLCSERPEIAIIEYGRSGFDHRFAVPGHGIESLDMEQLARSQLILYCAGAGVQPGVPTDDVTLEQVNTDQPIALIEALIARGYRGQVITFGSYFELGEMAGTGTAALEPRDESYLITHNNNLPNMYVRTKRHLSRYIAEILSAPPEFGLLHLVLTNVYGVGEDENRLLPYMARKMAAGEAVELTGGSQARQYTHVADIARFIVDRVLDARVSGIYNFTDPEVIQVRTLAERFCRLAGFDPGKLMFASVEKRDTSMGYLALSMVNTEARFGRCRFSSLDENLRAYLADC